MRTYTTVDAYLDALDDRRKVALQQLRRIILETVPDAQESIQYNMSAYAYHGMLCAFASQKHYMSFYVLDGAIVDQHRDLLKGLSVGKGCIRFRSIDALPETTVRTLLQAVAAANEPAPNDHC